MLFYSDGLENTLIEGRDAASGFPRFSTALLGAARLPVQEFVDQIARSLDTQEGSLNPQDDMTLVAMEILP